VHFNNPKPVKLIQYLLGTLENSDDIVLDFFAGSGTTAHAVMEQNAKDGGNRKFILVQLPETTDETSEAYKAGYKTIADIARERIRRAGQKVLKDNADKLKDRATPLDIGFKDFAVSPSNFIEIPNGANSQAELLLEENLKSNVSDQDLLTQLRLLQGQTINNQPKTLTFGDLTVFVQGSICYCLQANANIDDLKALLKAGFTKIVILDRCFKNNQDSTNFEQQYLALDRKINLETY
jgi:adenine-specific DNA-methyltransferase